MTDRREADRFADYGRRYARERYRQRLLMCMTALGVGRPR